MAIIAKRCCRCGALRLREHFTSDAKNRDGLRSWCKRCVKEYRRDWARRHPDKVRAANQRNRYGVEVQLDQCAICSTTTDLCVDHDHKLDSIRGVLCRTCNLGCGYFHDDAELLRCAAAYLEMAA